MTTPQAPPEVVPEEENRRSMDEAAKATFHSPGRERFCLQVCPLSPPPNPHLGCCFPPPPADGSAPDAPPPPGTRSRNITSICELQNSHEGTTLLEINQVGLAWQILFQG